MVVLDHSEFTVYLVYRNIANSQKYDGATKDTFRMTISNINCKLTKIFPKKLAFNAQPEIIVRIIQVNVIR
jgi:hypothetical protein